MSSANGEAKEYGFSTNAIHVGQDPDKWDSRTVVTPIILGTTFKQESPGNHYGYEYGRSGNPTRNTLEETLASLEKAKYAMVFSSGLGALTTINYLLKTGDHVVLVDDVYGGTNRFFRHCASRMGIDSTFVDMVDLNSIQHAFKDNTAMVWLETPTNPTLKLIDIKAVCDYAKKRNPNIITVVDNTFASAFFQNPLELGADIVTHSLTKYMNGHTDVVMGAVMLNDEELYKRLKFLQNALGAIPSPFDSFLVGRGLKTLALRMKEHAANGLAVAQALLANPRVEKVIYPGLESHPQYELYKRQMKGFGGMISIYIKGGIDESIVFLKSLKLFTLAESLGGYESLIEHPAIMTHASVPKDQRSLLGITDNFLRLSVGVENVEDLIEDINQALIKAVMASTFKQISPGVCHLGYDYGRCSNPTRNTLEETLASLEKAKYCASFSSGAGAITSMGFLLKTGDHILALDNTYGGTNIIFSRYLSRFGIETTFVDMLDLELVQKELRDNTAMVWFDTPSNPLLKIIDIKSVCEIVRKKNPKIIIVLDNTLATGYYQNPLDFSVDIVLNSLTKYMNGHSDVVMGAVMLNNEELYKQIKLIQKFIGAVPSPFDCYLVGRGLKTLALRMKQHAENGLAVARALEKNPRVERVFYPGLESHPQHELYKRQMRGFGGMIAVYIKGGYEETKCFVSSLKLFSLAVSLGGYESLVDIPAMMTRGTLSKEENTRLGITDNLMRISIGLEDVDDLINDLNQALSKAVPLKNEE